MFTFIGDLHKMLPILQRSIGTQGCSPLSVRARPLLVRGKRKSTRLYSTSSQATVESADPDPIGVPQFYWSLDQQVLQKALHPLVASGIIAKAIQNGYPPPEDLARTRRSYRSLIRHYIRRNMAHNARDEIDRCLARGLVDDYVLLHPMADAYINCLLDTIPAGADGAERAKSLVRAAQFLSKLQHGGQASIVPGKTYDRLIEKMNLLPIHCDAASVARKALNDNIALDIKSWNVHLSATAKHTPQTILQQFSRMTRSGVRPDKYSFGILLKCLRNQPDSIEKARKIIEVAKHLGIYNEHIAVEEMCLAKSDRQYQELLTIFSNAFGPTILNEFGFANPPTSTTAETKKLKVGKAPLSIMVDALVRVNASPRNLKKLHTAYRSFVDGREEFRDDVYTPSIFIRAFANFTSTLERSLSILETMKQSDRPPTVVTYTGVIDGLCRAGMMDLASKVVKHMEENGVMPNVYTWTIMRDGYEDLYDEQGVRTCTEALDRLESQSQSV